MAQNRTGNAQQSMQKRRLAWRCGDSKPPVEWEESVSEGIIPAAKLQVDFDRRLRAPQDDAVQGPSAVIRSSSACPVCAWSMTTPAHAPHLCCPCGHSLCLACVPRLGSDGSLCPCCNAYVLSTVPNLALHQLLKSNAEPNDGSREGLRSVAPEGTLPQSFTRDYARPLRRTWEVLHAARMQHDHVKKSVLLGSLKGNISALSDALASNCQESQSGKAILACLRKEEHQIRRQMISLNARLERVIQETQQQQQSLSQAEVEEKRIKAELAIAKAAVHPLQRDADKLHFLLQGAIELDTGTVT